ncbi:ATP-dependent DNA helicase PIF1-like protein [Tanacetum coccineum]
MLISNTSNSEPLMLDQLELGVTGTIVVMICRMWDVNSATCRYLSTDFIVSDEKMDGDTVVCKSSVRPDGFARYPFQLVEFYSLEPTNNKYLIDVVGYISLQLTLCHSIPFSNQGAVRKSNAVSFTIVRPIMSIKFLLLKITLSLYPAICFLRAALQLADRLYFSSTSSTMIVDNEQIHVLKQFKSDDSGIEIAKELLPAPTFHCAVRIDKIRTKRGWNYPSCGGEKCRKGNLDRKQGRFWCDSFHSFVDYPVLRYRLELEVSDDTAQTVVVMFDETAKTVVKCPAGFPSALANIVGTLHTLELKSNSYYENENYESFTCWSVVLEEALDESGSSRTLAAGGNPKTGVFVPLTTTPLVTTPSKSGEHKKPHSKECHDSDGEESFVADSKTKGSDVGCSSEAGLVLDSSE